MSNQNNSAAGSEIALRTFNVWSKLTTEEKALPAQELGALAEQIQIKSALTYTFGPASAVADYLYSPAIQHQATKVIGWINTVRSQNSDVINKKSGSPYSRRWPEKEHRPTSLRSAVWKQDCQKKSFMATDHPSEPK